MIGANILFLIFSLFSTPNNTISTTNSFETIEDIYSSCHLNGIVDFKVFETAYRGLNVYKPSKATIAIADFSKNSNEKRFYLIDLAKRELILNTWVAHGRNSGDRMATSFSNTPESFKSCNGWFSVGDSIISPKHGKALLLHGLQKGINDNSLKREIIMHGADYVSEQFIQQFGRLGRSLGCPALPNEAMKIVVPKLANGSMLYIHKGTF